MINLNPDFGSQYKTFDFKKAKLCTHTKVVKTKALMTYPECKT